MNVAERFRSDPSGARRALEHLPLATMFAHFDDAHALCGLHHRHRFGVLSEPLAPDGSGRALKSAAAPEHEDRQYVFVVHTEKAGVTAIPAVREEGYGVAVVAELTFLPLGRARDDQHVVHDRPGGQARRVGKQAVSPAGDQVV